MTELTLTVDCSTNMLEATLQQDNETVLYWLSTITPTNYLELQQYLEEYDYPVDMEYCSLEY